MKTGSLKATQALLASPYSSPETLGEELSLYRAHAGYSQKALARAIGADPGSIARWEAGVTNPPEQRTVQIKEFCMGLNLHR